MFRQSRPDSGLADLEPDLSAIRTIALLQRDWSEHQRNEFLQERDKLLGITHQRSEPPTQTGLDSLDDQSVDRLYHDSLRQYAKTVKRGPGILMSGKRQMNVGTGKQFEIFFELLSNCTELKLSPRLLFLLSKSSSNRVSSSLSH